MIEQSHRGMTSDPYSLESLQRRAIARRRQRTSFASIFATRWQTVRSTRFAHPASLLARLPSRVALHALVALLLPVAMLLSQLRPGVLTPTISAPAVPQEGSELTVPLAPVDLDAVIGDPPLEETADLPVPLSLISRSEALAPIVVPATIAVERAFLRNGPGTNYDAVGRISGATPVQVIGRYGDWFQVRERVDGPIYWISGEVLAISEAASYTLFEVQESAIPPPPPPKIATVREDGLYLRDGPGTNYVPITTLKQNTQIELYEIYEDWFHVGAPGGLDGWVKAEFLNVDPSVVKRLLVAETIPDPNPALVGVIAENSVNLRKGPDSRYDRIGRIDAGVQVDLIGKYKDWLRVRLPDGTKAWVFRDLINTTAHVLRRVPVSRDFPALPVSGRRPGASPGLATIAASGDVASFAVQFVGARYRWGGSSPSTGFDCSGFTSYVYRQFGVNLPRSAAAQFNTAYGASVGSMENLAPGDLMFFRNTGGQRGISHVAIYIGGGRMVHAMTPRYGVQVSSIWGSYWTSRYYGAIRVRR